MEKKEVSKAQLAANQRYERDTYKKIMLRIRTDKKGSFNYDDLIRAAEKEGIASTQKNKPISMQGYILRAIEEKMIRDGIITSIVSDLEVQEQEK
jgi:hypothetical protein